MLISYAYLVWVIRLLIQSYCHLDYVVLTWDLWEWIDWHINWSLTTLKVCKDLNKMRHVLRVLIKICRIILHDQIMKSLDWCDITKHFFCYPSLKHVNLPFASIFIFFQWFHQGMLDKGSSSKQVLNRQYTNTWLFSIVYNIYSNVKKPHNSISFYSSNIYDNIIW